MQDNLTPEDRRRTMQAVKSKGTGLERRLFSMLAGLRFKGWRKNASDVPGKPDVVFDRLRIAVFIDGCFWHGCPYCRHTLPKTNLPYWERKIRRNVERSSEIDTLLKGQQWTVLRVWEHELSDRASRSRVKQSMLAAYKKELRPG